MQKCPVCGASADLGLFAVYCSNGACQNARKTEPRMLATVLTPRHKVGDCAAYRLPNGHVAGIWPDGTQCEMEVCADVCFIKSDMEEFHQKSDQFNGPGQFRNSDMHKAMEAARNDPIPD